MTSEFKYLFKDHYELLDPMGFNLMYLLSPGVKLPCTMGGPSRTFLSPFDMRPVDLGSVLIFWYDKVLWARRVYFLLLIRSQQFLQEALVSFSGNW